MHIPFWNRKALPAEQGLRLVSALMDGSRRCVITTRSEAGEPHSRKLRFSNYSVEGAPALLFLIPKDGDIAHDIARDPSLVLSVLDPRSARLIHVEGLGALFDGHHSPAYLDPSVRAPQLNVIAGEVDFVLLRVEIQQIDGHVAETQPPIDVDLQPTGPRRGAAFFKAFRI